MSMNTNNDSTVNVKIINPRKLEKDKIDSRRSLTSYQQQSSKSSLVPNDRNYTQSIRVNIELISHFICSANIFSIYKGIQPKNFT